MSRKNIVLVVLLIIVIALCLSFSFFYSQGKAKFGSKYSVLLLTADPSEERPGIGAVDMAFVVNVDNGKVINMTPVYPGGVYHPTLSPPADLKSLGVDKYYLHDSLWDADANKGAKIAQEIVEHKTGMKTDMVVIVTPEAVDALIQSVGPIKVNGQTVSGNSINFLRDEQNNGMSRGNAIESVMSSLKNATQVKDKRDALIQAAMAQYSQGKIVVVPPEAFTQFIAYEGFDKLF